MRMHDPASGTGEASASSTGTVRDAARSSACRPERNGDPRPWALVPASGEAEAGVRPDLRDARGDDRAAIARSIVSAHTLVAAGTGFLPSLGQDVSALMLNQVVLLRRIGAVYGQRASEELLRTLLLALGTSLPAIKGSLPLLGVLKLVPGAGHLAGSLLLAATGAGISWATGMIFIQHFESGGSFLTFDPHAVRAHFRREFERTVLRRTGRDRR